MWGELDYTLETPAGKRELLIRSNFRKENEGRRIIDDGIYTILEDPTPYSQMSPAEFEAHELARLHWDAAEDVSDPSIMLGILHYDFNNGNEVTWSGDPGLFTNEQLIEIGEFAANWQEPDIPDYEDAGDATYIDEDGGVFEVKQIKFKEPEYGIIAFCSRYKTNPIVVRLVPFFSDYTIRFDFDDVGTLHRGNDGKWVINEPLFDTKYLVNDLTVVIEEELASKKS
jgi:hypothetical protein